MGERKRGCKSVEPWGVSPNFLVDEHIREDHESERPGVTAYIYQRSCSATGVNCWSKTRSISIHPVCPISAFVPSNSFSIVSPRSHAFCFHFYVLSQMLRHPVSVFRLAKPTAPGWTIVKRFSNVTPCNRVIQNGQRGMRYLYDFPS